MIGVGSGVLRLEESMKDFDLAGVEANLPFWPNDLSIFTNISQHLRIVHLRLGFLQRHKDLYCQQIVELYSGCHQQCNKFIRNKMGPSIEPCGAPLLCLSANISLNMF